MINNVYEEVLIKEGNAMKRKAREEGRKEAIAEEWKKQYNEGVLEGKKEGKKEGKDEEKVKIAMAMLKDHESTAKIIKYTGLTLDQIKDIAEKAHLN